MYFFNNVIIAVHEWLIIIRRRIDIITSSGTPHISRRVTRNKNLNMSIHIAHL